MRLRTSLAASLTATLAILALAAAWLSWLGVREEIKTGVANQLFSLVSYAARGIENDLGIALESTQAVARGVPVSAIGSTAALERYMGQLPMPMGAIDRCVALSPDGRALAQQPPLPPIEGRNFADRDYFRQVMATREAVISRPMRGKVSGAPVVVVAAPTLGRDGKAGLIVACTLNLLNERLFGEVRSAPIGKTGYLYVASRDRKIVLHPDKSRILADPPPAGVNLAADRAVEGFEGTKESANSLGVAALMSFKQLKAADWFVAAVYPLEEAYAPLREARGRMIAVALLSLLACGLCAWLLAGLLVRPVERLTRHVGTLRERSEADVPPFPQRDDEIGALAQAFNELLSELRERENSLRVSEEKFVNAFQSNPDLIMISRLSDGRIVEVNRGFEAMAGYAAAEVRGRTTADLGLWANRADREVMIRRLAADGQLRDLESQLKAKNGDVRQVLVAATILDLDGEPHVMGTTRDITELKRAQDALRQSEEKFAKVFHASLEWIVIVRLEDGLILDANEGFERLSGYSIEEAVGHTTTELGLWAYPERRSRFVAELKSRGSVSSYEFEIRSKDGTLRDTLASSVAIEIGGMQCMISIVRDISSQRRAEEEIRNLNIELEHRVRERTAELEGAIRELESFSYSVSHDLRSPLRAIAGYAKVIEEDYAQQIGAEGRGQLDRIVSNAVRMGELIDDMLDFARIGRVELKRAPIDMASMAREVLAELHEADAGRQIDVRIGALPTVRADRSLIRQVWINLLGNALKFTRRRERSVIEVGGLVEAGEAHFLVRDNGVGFDMQFANKLFHVFQRLHRDASFEGTGVGLAIIARVVQRHGGQVWAEGEPDKGATFHFTLPA